jgi:DNA-binding CsgD family transcriptional regulator
LWDRNEPIQRAVGPVFVAIRISAYPRFVTTLAERDASALLAFVSELRDLDDPFPFPPRLLQRLGDLIAADEVGYSEFDLLRRDGILGVCYNADGEEGFARRQGETSSKTKDENWWRLRQTHPVLSYRSRTGDWTSARKVSDFVTLREFRRTPIYDAFYRRTLDRWWVDYWLDVGLAPEAARTRDFIFTRHDRPDFDERDRLVATLLQPHLAKRAEEAEAALRTTEALSAIEDGAIEEARRVVLCSASGVIEFGSASSRTLLKRYLALDNGRVPKSVLARRELTLRSGNRSLSVRTARAENFHLLMLDECDLRIQRLTARERQVLEQAGLGKANDAIALELGIARATVAKHLEHVYRKLGVQNRVSAAALLHS